MPLKKEKKNVIGYQTMDHVRVAEERHESDNARNRILPGSSRIKPDAYHGKIVIGRDDDFSDEDGGDGEDDDDVDEMKNFKSQNNHLGNKINIGSKPNNTGVLGISKTGSYQNNTEMRSERLEKRDTDILRRNSRLNSTIVRESSASIPCLHCSEKFPDINALTQHLYQLIGIQAENKEASKSKEAVVKVAAAKKAAPKEAPAKDPAAKEVAHKEATAKEVARKKDTAKEVARKDTTAKHVKATETVEKKAAAIKADAKEAPVKEPAAKKADAIEAPAVKVHATVSNKLIKKEAEEDNNERANATKYIQAKEAVAKQTAVKVQATVSTKLIKKEAEEDNNERANATKGIQAKEAAAKQTAVKVEATVSTKLIKKEAEEDNNERANATKDIQAKEAVAKQTAVKVQATVSTKLIKKEAEEDNNERANAMSQDSDIEEIPSHNNAIIDLIHDPGENIDQKESNLIEVSKKYHKKDNISNKTGKIKIYFCVNCECFFPDKNHKEIKECSEAKKNKEICLRCGLYFQPDRLREHQIIHEVKNMTLNDCIFFNFKNKQIIPYPPDYFRCLKCKTQFLKKAKLIYHICGGSLDNSTICCMCFKVFHPAALRLHMQFHLYANEAQGYTEQSPETSNILYSCSDCRNFTDKYEFAVEHSQKHIINECFETYTNKICKICDMAFEPRAFAQHNKLHKRYTSPAISRDSFKILKYNYRNLRTGDWLTLFEDLPEQYNINDIISNSIYRATPNVRLKILRNGPGSMVYKCARCKNYIKENSVYRHTHNGYCSASEDDRENLSLIGSYSRIISFNDRYDYQFNKMLELDLSFVKKEYDDC